MIVENVPGRVIGTSTLARFVPIMIVDTTVPTIIVLTAYYWKSCGWEEGGGSPFAPYNTCIRPFLGCFMNGQPNFKRKK